MKYVSGTRGRVIQPDWNNSRISDIGKPSVGNLGSSVTISSCRLAEQEQEQELNVFGGGGGGWLVWVVCWFESLVFLPFVRIHDNIQLLQY